MISASDIDVNPYLLIIWFLSVTLVAPVMAVWFGRRLKLSAVPLLGIKSGDFSLNTAVGPVLLRMRNSVDPPSRRVAYITFPIEVAVELSTINATLKMTVPRYSLKQCVTVDDNTYELVVSGTIRDPESQFARQALSVIADLLDRRAVRARS